MNSDGGLHGAAVSTLNVDQGGGDFVTCCADPATGDVEAKRRRPEIPLTGSDCGAVVGDGVVPLLCLPREGEVQGVLRGFLFQVG